MTRHTLLQRLAALERRTTADDGMYGVDIGDGYITCNGEQIQADEWQRRYPDSIVINIGRSEHDTSDYVWTKHTPGEHDNDTEL